MDVQELRQLGPDELKTKIRQWKDERFRLKFRAQTSEVKDTSVFRKLRRDTARALTVLAEKQTGTEPVVAEKIRVQVADKKPVVEAAAPEDIAPAPKKAPAKRAKKAKE